MRRPSSPGHSRGAPPDGSPDLRIIRRIAPMLWPDDAESRLRVVAAMLFLVLSKLATVVAPFFYKAIVDRLAPVDQAGSIPVDALIVAPVALILAYGLSRIAMSAFAELRDGVFSKVGQRALRKTALKTFEHMHALSLRYHLERRTGALTRIIERGVMAIQFLLRFMLFSIIPLVLELALVAGILAWQFDISYFFVILATIAAYVVFTFKITDWRVAIRKQMNDQDQEASQKAVDSLLNFETVKYFTAESREAARYDVAMAGYEQAAIKTQISLGVLNFGQSAIIASGLAAVMVMAGYGVAAGHNTVGDFVMVVAFMTQLIMPLNFLGTVYREIRQALIDMRGMYELLDVPAEVADAPDAKPLGVTEGRVRFENVLFSYDPARAILKGVDFDLPGGKSLAVVGSSGSGKSTIARLIYRFYDIQGGAILVDGQDIRSVTQNSLRQAVGVVPQDTVLFNDTIRYNIAYGRDNPTEAQVIEAAQAAQIHDFIMGLPQGYDTQVGERGLKLSGGEKQRVAIARAILKNPPILILDEATSALDSETEKAIQQSLKLLAEGRTVITIAHRLSTIVDADEILVLEKGEVVERGRHEALLAKNGRYSVLWRRQEAEQNPVAD